MAEPPATGDGRTKGRLTAVHGSVVDVRFPAGALPGIDEGIEIERDGRDPLIAEVQQHLDPVTVRAVALDNTAGLSRGAAARAIGGSIRVPVGDAVLGRLLDAVGEPADRGPPLPPDTALSADPRAGARPRPARRGPANLPYRHQGHRPAGAVGQRRQGRDVRRRRRRQDRADHGADPHHGRKARRDLGVRRHRRALARRPRAVAGTAAVRRAGAHRAGVRPDERSRPARAGAPA